MARICCVQGCDAMYRDDLAYFNFPVKPTLRRQWREAMRAGKVPADAMVCSQHFSPDDYETVRGKHRLKARVVPTIFTTRPKSTSPKPQNSSKETNGKPTDLNDSDSKQESESRLNSNDTNEENKQTDKTDLPDQESEKPESKSDDLGSQGRDNNSNNEQGNETLAENQETDPTNQEYNVNCENLEIQFDFGRYSPASVDENGHEKCTIECVPEAILHDDTDSNSEADIHKEDIEDIIANYHIKQNKKLAERLKEQELLESENQKKDIQGSDTQGKDNQGKDEQGKDGQGKESQGKDDQGKDGQGKDQKADQQRKDKGSDRQGSGRQGSERQKSDKSVSVPPDKLEIIDLDLVPDTHKEPVFIELSVDPVDPNDKEATKNDCMIVMEDVQVELDPTMLMLEQDLEESAPEDDKKDNPISLLTSSDDDDVIIQEPKIDTVEVSDETDEDDVPLVKFVNPKNEAITKILWGTLYEYFCYNCHFKTTSREEFRRHKNEHSTVLQVCEICNFTTASKAQFARHKRRHRDEKRFKCHLCDYKAKHNMSLIYHLKNHEGVKELRGAECRGKKKKEYKCTKCRFRSGIKAAMLVHLRMCTAGVRMYSCRHCEYETKRKSDLRRHRMRKHKDVDTDDENETAWT